MAHGIREKVGLQQIVKQNAPKASVPIKRDVRDKRDSGWQIRPWDVAPYEKVEKTDNFLNHAYPKGQKIWVSPYALRGELDAMDNMGRSVPLCVERPSRGPERGKTFFENSVVFSGSCPIYTSEGAINCFP